MKLTLKGIKNQIRQHPTILLKKPWMILMVPLVIAQIIFNRFRKSKTIVYLTETNLLEITDNPSLELANREFKIIENFNEFVWFAEHRTIEDKEAGDNFVSVVKTRFKRGDFAIVYLENEKFPLSYVFITTKYAVFTPVGMTLPLPDKTFGMYDVYTFKAARSKGYYSHLFEYSIFYMKKLGYKKIWLWLMAHNIKSVKVHYKLGLKTIIMILTEKRNFGIVKKETKNIEMSLSELITS